jgi:multisubunit Na+/H+ antiporter MnhB subunit
MTLYPPLAVLAVGLIMILLTLGWQRERNITGIDAVLSAVSVGIVAVAALVTLGVLIELGL